MPAPTVYQSTDTSAPVLTGTVGDLVALLDACLVNGYGSQAAAGWTKAFSGTNTASYRQGANHQLYLDINDAAAGTGGAKEASGQGYKTMSAVATGTDRFGSSATNNPIRKSNTADATARTWLLVADAQTFCLFVLTGDIASSYSSFYFGDFYSFKSADAYNVTIGSRSVANSAAASGSFDASTISSGTTASAGWKLARAINQTTVSQNMGLLGIAATLFTSPYNGMNLADGQLYMARLLIAEASLASGLRGYLRGVYQLVSGGTGVSDRDTFSGTGDFAGRTFLVLKDTMGGAALAIETTAWDTSS